MKNPFKRKKLKIAADEIDQYLDQLPDVGVIYDKILAAKTLGELQKIVPDIKSLKELDPVSFLHLSIAVQLQGLNIRVTALENARVK